MKQAKEQGITLIALIITVIILVILAAVSINAVINTDVIGAAQKGATDYTQSAINENKILEDTASIMQDTIERVKNVTDGEETEIISEDVDYTGYFADGDGDGIVDSIIYADLVVADGEEHQWSDDYGTFTVRKVTTGLKEYEIIQDSYTDEHFGTNKVIAAKGSTGTSRFYAMALSDFNTGTLYCWYSGAYGQISNYSTVAPTGFGTGYSNTGTMITAWNNEKYGNQNDGKHEDIWGQIQDEYAKGWYVPSRAEWSAFAYKFSITSSNYSLTYGLNQYYWLSSLDASNDAWCFDPWFMERDSIDSGNYVRLGITF